MNPFRVGGFQTEVAGYGEENQTQSRVSQAADAAAVEPATGRKTLRSRRDVRSAQPAIFSRPASQLQSGMGASPKASTERSFCFWNDPGTRPGHSNSSIIGPGVRSGVVFELRSLSRNAALSRARQTPSHRETTGSHRGVQSTRARISQLLSRPAMGGTEPRAVSPLTPNRKQISNVSRRRRAASWFQMARESLLRFS